MQSNKARKSGTREIEISHLGTRRRTYVHRRRKDINFANPGFSVCVCALGGRSRKSGNRGLYRPISITLKRGIRKFRKLRMGEFALEIQKTQAGPREIEISPCELGGGHTTRAGKRILTTEITGCHRWGWGGAAIRKILV